MDLDINLFRGLITLVVMLAFLGICFQTLRRKNRDHFEEAGNLPFAEEKVATKPIAQQKVEGNE